MVFPMISMSFLAVLALAVVSICLLQLGPASWHNTPSIQRPCLLLRARESKPVRKTRQPPVHTRFPRPSEWLSHLHVRIYVAAGSCDRDVERSYVPSLSDTPDKGMRLMRLSDLEFPGFLGLRGPVSAVWQ